MLKGQDSKSGNIAYKGRESYSASYAKRMNRPTKPIILKKTGDFQKGIVATVKQSTVDFSSTDSKEAMLKEASGEVIFGLNEGSLEEFSPLAQDELIKNVKFKLGL